MSVNIFKSFALVALLVTGITSCKDRDVEKKIAELESRISELEGKKAAAPALTTTTPAQQAGLPTLEGQSATDKKPDGPLPVMQFANVEHDFGTINEGQSVEYTFAVKNTGEAPLVIQEAKPSCGCTVPDWSKTPIMPGATGFVKAKFDSSGKSGIQNKTITVTANTWPKQTVLRFKAMVTPKPTGADGPVK
jgi:hypothetical protein